MTSRVFGKVLPAPDYPDTPFEVALTISRVHDRCGSWAVVTQVVGT